MQTTQHKQYRKQLRAEATPAENRLWRALRGRRLLGLKFRRQHSIGSYIADFYCLEKALVVELDGGQHATDEGTQYDQVRTKFLHTQNINVIRFWNTDVLQNVQGVVDEITEFVLTRGPSPCPLPGGEGKSPD
jgi:very-short-patch-repair endonuclease